jgi:glutamine---fructose-6-phosphate transaminase (isomerizing)
MFMPTDAAAASMRQLADNLRTKGAALFTTDLDDGTPNRLPVLPLDHPETDPICLIQSFYATVVHLSAARGMNADRPRHLQKITHTR